VAGQYSCLYAASNKNILWPWHTEHTVTDLSYLLFGRLGHWSQLLDKHKSGLNGILSATAGVNKFIMRSDRIKMERNK